MLEVLCKVAIAIDWESEDLLEDRVRPFASARLLLAKLEKLEMNVRSGRAGAADAQPQAGGGLDGDDRLGRACTRPDLHHREARHVGEALHE